MAEAVGLLEIAGIASGHLAANEISKHTAVELWLANPICPGYFIVVVAGDTASVEAAMDLAAALGEGEVISRGMLANIDERVLKAFQSPPGMQPGRALGIVETFGAAPAILAADGAVKAAAVELVEVRIGGGMGGKALVCFTGAVDAVEAAAAHIRQLVEPELLAYAAVLPAPHPEIIAHWQ